MVFFRSGLSPHIRGSKKLGGAGSVNFTLPNGPYWFYAVGFDQFSTAVTNNVYCGWAPPPNNGPGSNGQWNLDGHDLQVAMQLTASNCQVKPFAPTNNPALAIVGLTVELCTAGPIASHGSCTAYGTLDSIQIAVASEYEFGGVFSPFSVNGPGNIMSGCQSLTAGAASVPVVAQGGNQEGAEVRIRVLLYSGASCGGAPTKIFTLPFGLAYPTIIREELTNSASSSNFDSTTDSGNPGYLMIIL
jgi:hypothetical protein